MSDLWRLVFDDERFNDMDMHHFSWGSAYKAEASDAVAVVRRGVESGTIKGEVVERMCVEHRSWLRDGDPSSVCAIYSWVRQYQGTPTRCKIVETLVIPVDGGEG